MICVCLLVLKQLNRRKKSLHLGDIGKYFAINFWRSYVWRRPKFPASTNAHFEQHFGGLNICLFAKKRVMGLLCVFWHFMLRVGARNIVLFFFMLRHFYSRRFLVSNNCGCIGWVCVYLLWDVGIRTKKVIGIYKFVAQTDRIFLKTYFVTLRI